jgi:transcription initiation factor IIE alpha subunit
LKGGDTIMLFTSVDAKIFCHNCKKSYYVYGKQFDPEKVQNCPHCEVKMIKDDWFRIIDAMLAVHDTNKHFQKINAENNDPIFTISIKGN